MADQQKTAKIREALKRLDPLNAKHWTDDGLPREGVVREFANDQTLSRKDISEAFPGFQRTKPKGDAPVEADAAAPAAPAPGGEDPLTGDVSPEARAAHRLMSPPDTEGADPAQNTGEFMTEDEVREVLETRVRDAEQAVADAQQGVRDANTLVQTRMRELQEARAELQREFPPLTAAQNIKAHLASEQAMREARVNGGRQPARIDLVMQRSNSRGWRRPVRFGQTATTPRPGPATGPGTRPAA